MNVKAVIFDFDGTLFDSMGIWESAGADYLSSIGYRAEDGLAAKMGALSMTQSAEYLKEHYALPLTVEEIIRGVNETVRDFYFNLAKPKEGAETLLRKLREKGIGTCIATASDRPLIEAALERCGMLKYFDFILTCTEVGHGKDEPYVFERALERLGTEKDRTAVFEDAYYAAKTAKDAGFFVVGVHDRYEARAEELRALADVYIGGFPETEELFN